MPEKIKIITPEYVELEYELAGLGSRLIAVALDTLIQAAILVVLNLIYLLLLFEFFGSPDLGSSTGVALLAIFVFLVAWGYYIFFDLLWSGQTPGKKALKLRVIHESGHPIDLQSSFIRNILRAVDYMFIGFVVMFVSKRAKRLGDFAARTVVVKERTEDLYESMWTPTQQSSQQVYTENYRLLDDRALANIHRLSKGDYERISHFLTRVSEVRGDIADDVAHQLAQPVMRILEFSPQTPSHMFEHEAFLSEVARAYERHRGQ